MQGKVASLVENHLQEIVKSLGFELYEVEYQKKQNGMNLTLFIIKKEGTITIQDCEQVHRTVDPILDELDPTNGSPYYLNVSSIGLDRPLKSDKDFNRCLGEEVIVKTYESVDGNKQLEGLLKAYTDNNIDLQVKEDIISINRSNIAVCKLNIKF